MQGGKKKPRMVNQYIALILSIIAFKFYDLHSLRLLNDCIYNVLLQYLVHRLRIRIICNNLFPHKRLDVLFLGTNGDYIFLHDLEAIFDITFNMTSPSKK